MLQVGGSWGESNWKWCNKCEGPTFAGGAGNCPAGEVHDHNRRGGYSLALNEAVFQGQDGWKWCNKCQGICFIGNADLGPCPNGGKHEHQQMRTPICLTGTRIPESLGELWIITVRMLEDGRFCSS